MKGEFCKAGLRRIEMQKVPSLIITNPFQWENPLPLCVPINRASKRSGLLTLEYVDFEHKAA